LGILLNFRAAGKTSKVQASKIYDRFSSGQAGLWSIRARDYWHGSQICNFSGRKGFGKWDWTELVNKFIDLLEYPKVFIRFRNPDSSMHVPCL
jgi:hypothetical protein